MDNPKLYDKCRQVTLKRTSIAPTLLSHQTWDKKGEVILDYGCGTGVVGHEHLLPLVEEHDGRLVSVDCSEQMIQHAKQTYPHERITYEVGDIMDDKAWPHGTVEFDKIFCHLVLHFVKDTQQILYRFHNNLAPNGQLALAFLTKSAYWKCHQHFGRHERWGRYMIDYEAFVPVIYEKDLDTQEEMRRQFANAGFTIVAMGTKIAPYNVNVDTAVDLYWSLYPFTTKVPEEEHKAFKSDIASYLQQVCQVDEDTQNLLGDYELFYAVVEKKDGERRSYGS